MTDISPNLHVLQLVRKIVQEEALSSVGMEFVLTQYAVGGLMRMCCGIPDDEQSHSAARQQTDLLDVQNVALQWSKCLPIVAS